MFIFMGENSKAHNEVSDLSKVVCILGKLEPETGLLAGRS